MTNTVKNCLNANNSTVPTTSAHETCTRFIAAIRETYPELRALRYHIVRHGRRLTLRARFRNRSVFVCDADFRRAMRRFSCLCLRKVAQPLLLTN